MAESKDSFPVEVRRLEREVHETGVGVGNRTDVVYQLGAEINGAWVTFGERGEGHVQGLQEAQKASDQASDQPSDDTQSADL